MKKNKKIYAKIKEPILFTADKAITPVDFVEQIFNIENVWLTFINDVGYYSFQVNLPPEENVFFIYNELNNEAVANYVIRELMKIETYNPYKQHIPLANLKKDVRNIIIKKQIYIKENANVKFEHTIRDIKILIMYNTNQIDLATYYQNYDLIILFNSHSTTFCMNNKSKNKLNFENLYTYLNCKQEDVWEINNNIIKTIKFKKSNFNVIKDITVLKFYI